MLCSCSNFLFDVVWMFGFLNSRLHHAHFDNRRNFDQSSRPNYAINCSGTDIDGDARSDNFSRIPDVVRQRNGDCCVLWKEWKIQQPLDIQLNYHDANCLCSVGDFFDFYAQQCSRECCFDSICNFFHHVQRCHYVDFIDWLMKISEFAATLLGSFVVDVYCGFFGNNICRAASSNSLHRIMRNGGGRSHVFCARSTGFVRFATLRDHRIAHSRRRDLQ